jgi:hypothetical protein
MDYLLRVRIIRIEQALNCWVFEVSVAAIPGMGFGIVTVRHAAFADWSRPGTSSDTFDCAVSYRRPETGPTFRTEDNSKLLRHWFSSDDPL